MKLTVIITDLDYGGAQIQTIISLNALVNKGYSIQLLCLTNYSALAYKLDKRIKINYLSNKKLKTLSTKALITLFNNRKKITKLIEPFQPDIIVGVMVLAHLSARLVKPSISSKPKIVSYHHATELAQDPPNSLFKKIGYAWFKHLSKRDDAHIFISKAVKNDISSYYPIQKGIVVYNALPKVTPTLTTIENCIKKFSLTKNNFIIIPGRMHTLKGQTFFLNATYQIIKRHQIKVVFAGLGTDSVELNRLSEQLQVNDLTVQTGKLENEELLALIYSSKLCIVPSLQEGLGNVAIEALMLGKTVLTSNAGGLPEVITHNKTGYIFKKGNVIDLQHQLKKLLTNYNQLKIDKKELQNAFEEKFSVESHSNALHLFFQSLN